METVDRLILLQILCEFCYYGMSFEIWTKYRLLPKTATLGDLAAMLNIFAPGGVAIWEQVTSPASDCERFCDSSPVDGVTGEPLMLLVCDSCRIRRIGAGMSRMKTGVSRVCVIGT